MMIDSVLINALNIMALAIAYAYVTASFFDCNKKHFSTMLVLVITIETIALIFNLQAFSMLPITIVAAYFIYKQINYLIQAMFIAATSMLLIIFNVLLNGSLFLIFIPGIHNQSVLFNLMISAILYLNGIAFYALSTDKGKKSSYIRSIQGPQLHFCDLIRKYQRIHKWVLVFIVYVEMAILVFLSFILPISFLSNNDTLIKQIFYITLAIMLLSLLLSFIYLMYIEAKKIKLESDKISEQIILEKHNEIIKLDHYYKKLFLTLAPFIEQGDIKQLRKYFHQYIVPIHKRNTTVTQEKLEKIENMLIRNLFLVTAHSIRKVNSEIRNFEVHTVYHLWKIEQALELKLFQILSIVLENAMEELQEQAHGYLNITIRQDSEKTVIRIENTIEREIEMSKITQKGYTTKNNHSGIGLYQIHSIIQRCPNIEHMTFIEYNLFVQQFIIY